MSRKQIVVIAAAAVIALLGTIAVVQGAYLEQDHGRREPHPPERMGPPPPRPRNEICDLISRIWIDRPYSVDNLRVFPLRLTTGWGHSEYKTLDESLSRGYIEVLEEKRPNVRSILVRNNSRFFVFLMAGEALGGGKQNRLIAESVLLSPHGGVIRVPVYCIEKGRWSGGESDFRSGGFMAPSPLRELARDEVSQRALWDAVDTYLRETGSHSTSEDLAAAYTNREIAAKIASYGRRIRIPLEDTVGCVVVRDSLIIGCDILSSSELFRKLWPKLLASYALDAIAKGHGAARRPPPPSEREIRRFLYRTYRASYRERRSKDAGKIVEVAGMGIAGEGLVFRDEVVHVYLGARQAVRF